MNFASKQILVVKIIKLKHTHGLNIALILLFRKTFEITNYLTEKNVPHNVIFLKSDPLKHHETFEQSKTTIRVIIWPKKPAYGRF